jgi:hypothetical protein
MLRIFLVYFHKVQIGLRYEIIRLEFPNPFITQW